MYVASQLGQLIRRGRVWIERIDAKSDSQGEFCVGKKLVEPSRILALNLLSAGEERRTFVDKNVRWLDRKIVLR